MNQTTLPDSPSGRQLPVAELRGPVELEAPLQAGGLEGLDRLDGLDDRAALEGAPTAITSRTGAAGRPVMATLDDETPPNGIPRSALLGLRPADRPHTDRHADRGGSRKGDREPHAPTGPVRLDTQRVETPRPDGSRSQGAVPLPRRRPTPTLVAEHGRRVEPRPVSVVPQPSPASPAGSDPGSDAGAAAPGIGGLPRRVRQASLAPQLKKSPSAAPAEAAPDQVADRDAEDVRTRMSALQRGWTAGRNQHAQQKSETEAGTSAAGGPANENEGDGR
ncbi:hypothetical protein [Streptomyces nojiriensis]|uniref:hypothetical protein n=1 Tax=Streptomyces nojiriensis TaxID=66374 RepID=UPI0036635ADE